MTMITPSYLGETIEYSSLHACRSTLEDPTAFTDLLRRLAIQLLPKPFDEQSLLAVTAYVAARAG